MNMLSKLKLEVVEDAREAYKFASVQLGVLWSLFVGFVAADPHFIANLWAQIPPELRNELPDWMRGLVTALIVLSTLLAARLLRRKQGDGRTEKPQGV